MITAATFWTWLWEPIGLILATPLTMCLVVLGRHVDQLKFLDVMFGMRRIRDAVAELVDDLATHTDADERRTGPAMNRRFTPAELIYQRMLARDPVEAADQARIFLKERPLPQPITTKSCWRV